MKVNELALHVSIEISKAKKIQKSVTEEKIQKSVTEEIYSMISFVYSLSTIKNVYIHM